VVIDIDKLDGCHEEEGEKERGGFEAENKKIPMTLTQDLSYADVR
jgi:hypothetical protein